MSPKSPEQFDAADVSERQAARREVAAVWIICAMVFPLVAAWWLWADTLIEHLAVIAAFFVAAVVSKRIEHRLKGSKGDI
ncbi:hypothetical protein [Usitatibacter rugosus]|uniref:hypothetical protein n=1 Tax=Usitatibacter rugosus TaxID=2732067 RepID=UPI0014878664|nr:hypothetical protein [Usitatibacter rugosus]